MKVSSVSNDNMVIQARNQADYFEALEVANRMVENNPWMEQCSQDNNEFWVQLASCWSPRQAADFVDAYKAAKI